MKTPLEYMSTPKNGGLCHILCVKEDPAKTRFWPNSPCHANLINIQGKDVKTVYSSCWINKAITEEEGNAYFDFILDPVNSPFREALKDVDIVLDKNGKRIAFGVQNNGCPNQIIGSLMIASRLPWEFPDYARGFLFFKKFGFSPVEAYYLCHHFTYTKAGRLIKGQHMGHMTHNVGRGISLKCLIEGPNKVLNRNSTWINGHSVYNPTIAIWEHDDTIRRTMWNYQRQKVVFTCLNQKNKYEGVFPTAFKKINGGENFPDKAAIVMPAEEAAALIMKTDRKDW